MKIALLGFDVEGKASYDYFAAQGHEITICDQNSDLQVPDGTHTVLGETYLDNLDRFDLLVRTAGLPLRSILTKNPHVADKVTTQTNEFLRVCPTSNIIGVTGTKGKGTTCSLIVEILRAVGKDAHLGGNIGVPVFSLLDKLTAESWVVFELSSFQLEDLKHPIHIGICLMMAPEHLNWHKDLAEYTTAKAQLFSHQRPEDIAIYLAGNELSHEVASHSPGNKFTYFAPPGAYVNNEIVVIDSQEICHVSELKLLGRHNWQNVCAAVTAVWQVTQDVKAIRSVLTSFAGLPYRLELIRELEGVRYYNDSFGTTPDTATVAIEAFAEPKIVILGGRPKGAPFDKLAETIVKSNVKHAIVIGEAAPTITSALKNAGYKNIVPGGNDMPAIVAQAQQLADPGDVILLSTACASFDMFKDYKDRGTKFNQAVQALA